MHPQITVGHILVDHKTHTIISIDHTCRDLIQLVHNILMPKSFKISFRGHLTFRCQSTDTHTHHAHAHTHACAHTQTRTHAHTHERAHTRARRHMRAHTHTRTCVYALARMPKRKLCGLRQTGCSIVRCGHCTTFKPKIMQCELLLVQHSCTHYLGLET